MTVSAQYLASGRGGIARAARLSLKALADIAEVEALSVEDTQTTRAGRARVQHFSGSRLRFALANTHRVLEGRRVLYDFPGTARAHPPGLQRHSPYALWIHGTEVWGRPAKVRPDYAAAVRRATLVLVNSALTLDRAQEALGPLPNARLCWLGTENDEPPDPPPEPSGPPTVVILARIDALAGGKGHAELLECWPKVVASVPGARLLIAGGGQGLDDMRRLAAASPRRDHIEITGFVSEDGVDPLWRRSHVLAMPSRQEGFGLVYVEAMRFGLPVIASVHDAGQELNVNGVTGYNVDLDVVGQLADRLIALLGNRDRCRAMGQAGFARWQEHFRFSAFKGRFLPIVEEFLSPASRSREARASPSGESAEEVRPLKSGEREHRNRRETKHAPEACG